MGLETFTGKVSDLVATNPPGTDPKSQGDDHLRGIKTTIIGQSVNMQLGQSATATQNFTFTTGLNGTMKLARGNVGATTQDVMTVDAAGVVAFPQSPAQTWQTVTGSRVLGTVYTNSTGRPIVVSVTIQGTTSAAITIEAGAVLIYSGQLVGASGSVQYACGTALIPAGATYTVTNWTTPAATLNRWTELR